MKPIAPQGEWLTRKILLGYKEIAIIFMGQHAEMRARGFFPDLPYTMYLPFKTSPYAYTWPVNGCEIYLVDTSHSSDSFLKTFVMCLFMQGAVIINYLSSHINQQFIRS
jgi:hypothetical protein